jgi:type II secretory pathway pseudopilin PulG
VSPRALSLRPARRRGARAGLTLVELVLALGLAAMLMAALLQLLTSSLSLWRRAETEQSLLEQGSVVGDLLAEDLRELDGTPAGDLVVEWVPFQTDPEGARDTYWPRLRFVRTAGRAEIARLRARAAAGEDRGATAAGALRVGPGDEGRVEVLWCALPRSAAPDERSVAVLYRGERLVSASPEGSFLAPGFFRARNEPPPGAAVEVTSDLLWMDVLLATQTSIVHDGWKTGDGLEDAATSWDAWNRSRPDPTWHYWNQPGAGMPDGATERPILPRRVRVELEFERDKDRRRRTRLTQALAPNDGALRVANGRNVPGRAGAHVKIDAEWMRIVDVTGDHVVVRRGQRGTQPVRHAAGAMVHWGASQVREVPIAMYREDWDL